VFGRGAELGNENKVRLSPVRLSPVVCVCVCVCVCVSCQDAGYASTCESRLMWRAILEGNERR
jgi:hypothetical protein